MNQAHDTRYTGATITRHYYTVRTDAYTRGIEFMSLDGAMRRAAEHLESIPEDKYVPRQVQIDTRITISLPQGGSDDIQIDKMIVTPEHIERINANRKK